MPRLALVRRLPVILMLLVLAGAATLPARADDHPWTVIGYVQQSFPKQTSTNAQIGEINRTFGTHFKDWSDVANLAAGFQVYQDINSAWQFGFEFDYSQGSIDGKATVETEAGPAELAFKQSYSTFADFMFVARYLPCRSCDRFIPVVYGGAGFGYESDRTTLTLRNAAIDEFLAVDNSGRFPVATAGLALDVRLGGSRHWFLEGGGAYFWGRLKHGVPAAGGLAPSSRVTADTDSTGPNYWLGVGCRF